MWLKEQLSANASKASDKTVNRISGNKQKNWIIIKVSKRSEYEQSVFGRGKTIMKPCQCQRKHSFFYITIPLLFLNVWNVRYDVILPVYGERRQLGIAYLAEIALTEGISAKIIKHPFQKITEYGSLLKLYCTLVWQIHSPHLKKKGWDGSV